MNLVPVNVQIVPGCDVFPFDDHRAIELLRVLRPAHQQPRPVFVIAVDHFSSGAFRRLVAVRGSRVEILLLDVAARLEVFERREERLVVSRVTRRGLRRDGARHHWVRAKQ